MTPKEKAEDLVMQYHKLVGVQFAKFCALIAVDEMIAENESVFEMLKIHGNDRNTLPVKFRIMWLQSVKNEINKL
jgi:hypothetical protein